MLRTKLLVLCIAAALWGCGASSSPAPAPPAVPAPPPDPFEVKVAQLNDRLSPLMSPDPYSALDDLAPLAVLGDTSFVGLGEATHGTREFFQLKHKILRYLVENHDFRVFAIEADMAESVYIDRHVAGDDVGDLGQLMRDRMHFWTWLTAEVREQIEWMRGENISRAAGERLHYFGIDCQIGTWYPDLIVEYVADTRPDLVAQVDALVDPFRIVRGGEQAFYQSLTSAGYQSMRDGLDDLLALFDTHQASMTAASNGIRFRLARRLVYNLRAIHESMWLYFTGNQQQAFAMREACMAENTLFVPELYGAPLKTVVWGHNAHIGYGEQAGQWMMGGHIRNAVGQDYRTVGFSFTRGTLTAAGPAGITTYTHNQTPPPGSTTELLHAAAEPDYIVDLASLPPGSELALYLDEWRPLLTFGALFNDQINRFPMVRLREQFDFLIHIDESTNSVLIR